MFVIQMIKNVDGAEEITYLKCDEFCTPIHMRKLPQESKWAATIVHLRSEAMEFSHRCEEVFRCKAKALPLRELNAVVVE